jgi:transmembrane sensor
MKDYTFYSVLDFSTDEYFRSWVLQPDPESIAFWESWIEKNPSQKEVIFEAAEMLAAVRTLYSDNLTEESRREAIDNLFVVKAVQPKEDFFTKLHISGNWYKVAAFWLLVTGFAATYYLLKKPVENSRQAFTVPKSNMIVHKNETKRVMTVLLGDGSVISLEKGSTVTYPEKFSDSLRTLSLTGEAFFDIARDPSKPFIVYSENTMTKVLGTSFRIKSSKENVLVLVKTGKVSVRSATDLTSGNSQYAKEVFLSPNQQALYSSVNENFQTSLVKKPEEIASDADKQEQGFDEASLPDILRALEKTYGIHIFFEESQFASCRLTTQFNDETLRQRLQAICQVTGASFRITEGQVIIEGNCEP